jgi:PAS domain S-box-containing protein
VLLIEDDEDDYLLTRELFADMNGGHKLDWASDFESGLQAMRRQEYDLCLLDYRLGSRTGVELLREASAFGAAMPTILLTGQGEREIDIEAAEAGASDFLEKGRLDATLLERSIRYARERWRSRQELERRVEQRTAELKWANDELRASEARFRMAVESADIGAWDFNPVAQTLQWSERCKAMFGLPPDAEVSYAIFLDRLHPDDRQRADRAVKASLQSSSDGQYEISYRAQWPDGTVRWIVAKGKAFFEGEGDARRAVRFIGTVRDTTQERETQQRIQNLVEELRVADRRKDEFLAILAHELRNPLAPVRTGLEVMKLAADNPEIVQEVRATMERQVEQLVRLVDDLLEVSRITRGKLELRPRRVELSEVIQSAVEASRPFIDEAGHQLLVSVAPEPVYLNADPHRLAQVVSNLLNNAARYTPDRGTIRLTAGQQDHCATISVKDTGVGIPRDMQARIFEMFTQIDRSLEKGYRGLGIGLTLVKSLIDLHGGTVEVHSAGENQGSEFIVRLPIWRDEVEGEHALPLRDVPVGPHKKQRVLVVDDNRAAADMLGRVVQMLGHEVRTAYDGAQGLEAAAAFLPDVMILDLGMPDLDGYAVAQSIRRQPWGQDITLIALTGWGQEEDRRRTKTAGFDHHLVKPIEPAQLQALLSNESASLMT